MSTSDKIDRVLTNRILGLPIFAAVMTLVYYIAISTVGGALTDWTNDVFRRRVDRSGGTELL